MFYQIEDKKLTRTILKTKRNILSKAFHLFSSEGVFRTTMVDISDSAAITRRTLYNHYNTKEEIAQELNQLLLKDLTFKINKDYDCENLTVPDLKKYIFSLYNEIISDKNKLQFIVRFDHFAQENIRMFKKKELFVDFLVSESCLLRSLHIFKDRGYFQDNSVSPELLTKVILESFLAFLERIPFRESSHLEEGLNFQSDIEFLISTLLSIIPEGGKD